MSNQPSVIESALSGLTKRNKKRSPPTCFECREVGHIHRYCTAKKSKEHKARVAEGQSRKQDSVTESGDKLVKNE